MEAPYVFIENASSEEYRKKLEEINALGINPFAEEHLFDPRFGDKEKILETNHWSVFTNQHKYNDNIEHQIMLVSKQEVATLWDLTPQAFINLHTVMKKVCVKLNILGGGFVTRFGDPSRSGATVKHLHLQLLVPRDGCSIAAWFGSR